jgi:hypothetical protein
VGKLSPDERVRYAAHRVRLRRYLAAKLVATTRPADDTLFGGGADLIRKERRKEAMALSRAWLQSEIEFSAQDLRCGHCFATADRIDLRHWVGAEVEALAGGNEFVTTGSAGISNAPHAWDPLDVAKAFRFGLPLHGSALPAPRVLDPALADGVVALLTQAGQREHARHPDGELTTWLDAAAEVLLAAGKKEMAIAEWQKILDDYPKSPRFKEIEKKMEDLLGVSEDAKAFETLLKTCDAPAWPRVVESVALAAYRGDGSRGAWSLYDKLKKACPAKPDLWNGVARRIHLWSGPAADCDVYRALKARGLQRGGYAGDTETPAWETLCD